MVGLIPAHAGKTLFGRRASRRRPAHPRSRGENVKGHLGVILALGSSPLTRGKPGPCRARGPACGLIPAHAGKTRRCSWDVSAHWAHPRSRGENSRRPCTDIPDQGSSPLTRGKPQQAALAVNTLRLIPAHAGKTTFVILSSSWLRAHPRSRGENFQASFSAGSR